MSAVEWVRRVFHDGAHCAVTDLVRWRGALYLAFRHAERHANTPPGDIWILRSRDGADWERVGLLSSGLDDRDPKLVAEEDRLWCFWGAARLDTHADGRPVEGGRRWIESHASWTQSGTSWEVPRAIHEPGWWLWRPLRFADGWWSTAYGRDLEREPPVLEVRLFHSADGVRWHERARLCEAGEGNEGTLHRRADGSLLAVVRAVGEHTWLFEAEAPYTRFERGRLEHWAHAPALCEHEGALFLAGRARGERDEPLTRLWRLEGWQGGVGAMKSVELCSLPSGGDNSYCGLVADGPGALLVSYYSQHEFEGVPGFVLNDKPAALYLARVRV